MTISQEALDMAAKVEAFVRAVVIPYEGDPRRDDHGAPTDELFLAAHGEVIGTGSSPSSPGTANALPTPPAAEGARSSPRAV